MHFVVFQYQKNIQKNREYQYEKQHNYFFSRHKILNEKCSNLSILSKTIYHKVIGLRYRQSFYKRQIHNLGNRRELEVTVTTVTTVGNTNEVNVIKCHQVQLASLSTYYFLLTIHYRWLEKPESVTVSFSVPIQ